ncbi:alanine/glycine:cation symporter family protein [Risungbinella massiliensis]|uniref:alanine/glycine:cation symporter family protein n=1 Tax=Risungbinella massiliensis TaxID=1329796 RepID=UPI0005CB8615|nr:alanine/glycine:cation symporter family protein [Risungbinella massiliensis]
MFWDQVSEYVASINDIIWTYLLIAILIGVGLYFSVRLRFVQFRQLGEMIRQMSDGFRSSGKKEGVSSFQAFSISTASRIGVGNLAGVAMAISLGGPGAVFWMWLIAIIGSASAFVESTLAQIYKVRDGETFRGGPAYYMEKGLNKRWMGITFAVLITMSFGLVFNAVQANTITLAFQPFGIDRATMGIVIAIIIGIVIFGGVKRIARTAEMIVPAMAIVYIAVAMFVMLKNITLIPSVFSSIFAHAFGLEAIAGGGVGAAMLEGIKRGLFTNEAGMGSAPNAAATANVSHPVKQGFIQALSALSDTLLVCSSTAFIVLFSGVDLQNSSEGISLTQAALSSQIGPWASYFIAGAILLFAFTTLIGNYYYGETNIEFLGRKKGWVVLYRVAAIGMILFGSVAKVQLVWDLADLFMGAMALINLIAIFLLGKHAFAALKDYNRQRKLGKDPVFEIENFPELQKQNLDVWKKK